MKKDCFSCKHAKPIAIQETDCICKAEQGELLCGDYWVDAADIKNCNKWEGIREDA